MMVRIYDAHPITRQDLQWSQRRPRFNLSGTIDTIYTAFVYGAPKEGFCCAQIDTHRGRDAEEPQCNIWLLHATQHEDGSTTTNDILRNEPSPDFDTAVDDLVTAINAQLKPDVQYDTTIYSRGSIEYHAIQIPWPTVAALLGHEHTGSHDDDQRLVDLLHVSGAPAWVQDAEGWIDECGWGLIGPPIQES